VSQYWRNHDILLLFTLITFLIMD